MLVIMEAGVSEEQIQNAMERMIELGFDVHRSSGMTYTVLGGIGDAQKFDSAEFRRMPGVREAIRITSRWKLAALSANPTGTHVRIGDLDVGGEFVVLPGGATVREIWESSQMRVLAAHADALLVPPAAMENQSLLRELGRAGVPVILQRSETATVDDWLTAADLVLRSGNTSVVLCESGVRTVSGRILDVGAIAEVRALSHLPVIAAPHGLTERKDVLEAIENAARAAGAHGLLT